MKSFIDMFSSARAISTPLVTVRTFDPSSTIQSITKSLGKELAALTPLVSWDSIHGLVGLNKIGGEALNEMASEVGGELAATVDLTLALTTLEKAKEDVIAFIHNPQLVWEKDQRVIQAEWNCRNLYKARGNMLVNLVGMGDELPGELQQDMLVLEEPLPTREELAKIVTDTFAYAAQKYPACKNAATAEVIEKCVAATIGLPAFPAEQAFSQSLDMKTGKMDFASLWSRKKTIVSANPGLTYHINKGETLKDMYGCDVIRTLANKFFAGKYRPNVIVRMDEIQRQFSGNGTDSSGTKGNLLGEWLTWVNDNDVVCTLLLGVPGSSKSWSVFCIGGEFETPVIEYSLPAMEHEHVGKSSRHQRTAHKVLNAISGGVEGVSNPRIWLIASANSLDGLPPELISRFQVGGIYFFDVPDEAEKQGIMKLKIAKYKLDPKQPLPKMDDWTGRDVNNCAFKAEAMGMDLTEAGQHVVPLLSSHREQMDNLRNYATGRFLSASKPGVYKYSPPVTKYEPSIVPSEDGRKFR